MPISVNLYGINVEISLISLLIGGAMWASPPTARSRHFQRIFRAHGMRHYKLTAFTNGQKSAFFQWKTIEFQKKIFYLRRQAQLSLFVFVGYVLQIAS